VNDYSPRVNREGRNGLAGSRLQDSHPVAGDYPLSGSVSLFEGLNGDPEGETDGEDCGSDCGNISDDRHFLLSLSSLVMVDIYNCDFCQRILRR
jgi:hypothetical protein